MKSVDAAVGTDSQHPQNLFKDTKSIGIATSIIKAVTKFENNTETYSNVATQTEGNQTINSRESSPLMTTPSTQFFQAITSGKLSSRSDKVLLEEIRKQLAHVRYTVANMDNVVDINDINTEMMKRGKDIVDARSRAIKENNTRHQRHMSKLAESLQQYIRDVESSDCDNSDKISAGECQSKDIGDWNLHGNADVYATEALPLPENDLSVFSERTSPGDVRQFSESSTRSLPSILYRRGNNHMGLKVIISMNVGTSSSLTCIEPINLPGKTWLCGPVDSDLGYFFSYLKRKEFVSKFE